jgi:hypothetical protein
MSALGSYSGDNMVLPPSGQSYSGAGMESLVAAPNTGGWYKTQYGCLKSDPTMIARFHSFPDAMIPDGVPHDPAAPAKICLTYRTAWPQSDVDAADMVDTERNHPQFAFSPGGPGTPYQIDVESQLRRLDQPLTNCQGVLPPDAPLFRNTVAPPRPTNVPPAVQNAANPIAAIMVRGDREDCRVAADAMATSMSGRWLNNPTRQDTMRFDKPFSPPGTGTGEPRGPAGGPAGLPYFA